MSRWRATYQIEEHTLWFQVPIHRFEDLITFYLRESTWIKNIFTNLRRHILYRACITSIFLSGSTNTCYTKVHDLYSSPLTIPKQDILQLKISVNYAPRMTIVYSPYYLNHYCPCLNLGEFYPTSNIAKELASLSIVHY